MSRSQARIFTSVWNDEDFTSRSAAAQRMYFLSLSQDGLSLCGVVSYTARRWARLANDTTVRGVAAAVNELVEHRFVVVDPETEELWVRRFLKWDGVLKSPNLIIAMSRDFLSIHSEPIREGFLEGLPEGFLEGLPKPIRDGLADGFVERFSRTCERASRAHGAEPLASYLLPPTSSSRPAETLPPPAVEEDDFAPTLEGTALAILAARHIDAARTNGVTVANPAAYLKATVAGLRTEHTDRLATAPTFPDPEHLADWLEPPPPAERRAKAEAANRARNDGPLCPGCDNNRWTETEGGWTPCTTCQPVSQTNA